MEYTTAQIRAAEEVLLAAGVPLMQRASSALAREIRLLLDPAPPAGASVLILAGSGNNGGDALLAAALLAPDVDVTVVATGARLHEDGLAAALAAGASLIPYDAVVPASVALLARRSTVVVDGILGTGTTGSPAVRGKAREVIEAIRPLIGRPGSPLVVAVDLPSGIGPDDGSVPDPTVLPADLTVTFGAMKIGLLRQPAAAVAGRVVLVDIGLTEELERLQGPPLPAS